MRKRIIFIALFTQIILASFVFAQTSQITNGLNYLSSTQNEEGFWASENELTLTTAETIKTLKLLNQTSTSGYTLALSWLQNQPLETTNHLAERIYILAASGADSNLLTSYMYAALRAWGGYNDFTVNNLDTALALQALRAINYADQTVIQAAINYLLTNQNTDGGWGFYKDDTSNVYMTAIVSRTLQHFPQTTAIANAVGKASTFIIAKQNSGGGFGSSSPTVYETALAYIALVGVTTDNTVLGNAAQFITNAQLPNGSWNDDPYTTALALQALYYSVNKPPPPTPSAATITGAVISDSTKQTLKGVSVVLQSNTAINTTTDATGKFTLTNVPKGAQQISFSLAGYATATVSVNATEGALINLGNIPLLSLIHI